MTTYMQEEYEALALEEKPILTDVKVNTSITNHPDELTDKEVEKVTSVFRSLETGLREATIYPRVRIKEYYQGDIVCNLTIRIYTRP